ncbi:MAG TPA: sigma-54 dependent transcriptional regulator [Fibrobacteria bacterium]|nr:sigma-54 dependent transcriptional regulator [Fibrobacteria bacterium]
MAKLLVVDDDAAQRRIVASILKAEGHDVREAGSVPEALEELQRRAAEVVLTDLRMPGPGGLSLLDAAMRLSPAPEVVVVTAFGSVDTAVQAMRRGAYDYLAKPLEKDELVVVVQRAAEKYRLRGDASRWRQASRAALEDGIVAESPVLRELLSTLDRISRSDATVLIQGESGTGKERVARMIHAGSPRGAKPMLAVNCAAFPENLLEAELFGYEKGAFTGATARKIGLFEALEGSTLFLDEIGDMPLTLQAKLLRVAQEKEIRRVGGLHAIPVDVRIVAATHRDLQAMVARGTFREDLFYRLNVIPVRLPPLRERLEDVPALARDFLAHPSRRRTIAPDALEALCRYPWPGNVRELQAVLERTCVLAPGAEIRAEDLPPELRRAPSAPGAAKDAKVETEKAAFGLPRDGLVFEELERDLIRQALERTGGSLADAARLLGMTYRTFQYRAAKFGLHGGDHGGEMPPPEA